jgi:hypothetical protein
VYIDGRKFGTVPCLCAGLSGSSVELSVRSGDRRIKQSFRVSAAETGLSRWEPRFPDEADSWAAPVESAEAVAYSGDATLSLGDVAKLGKNFSLALNGESVAATGTGELVLPAGLYFLQANVEGKAPLETILELRGNETLKPVLAFSSGPSRPASPLARVLTTVAGVALGTVGFVANVDAVSIPLSAGNYDLYTTVKYGSLACIGSGAVMAVVGLLIGGAN